MLLAKASVADETGLVYFVYSDGEIKPVHTDEFLTMRLGDPRMAPLVLLTRPDAERASLRVRGVEAGQPVQRN
jgi:hypothetical protein